MATTTSSSTQPPPTPNLLTLDTFEQRRSEIQEIITMKKLVWQICMKCASSTPEQIVQLMYTSHTKYTKEWEKLQRMTRQCGQQHSIMITGDQLYQQCILVGRYRLMVAGFQFCRWKSQKQLIDLTEQHGSSWMADQRRMDMIVERWMRRRQVQQQHVATTPQMNNDGHDDNKRMRLS
jgi:hypothetical protein